MQMTYGVNIYLLVSSSRHATTTATLDRIEKRFGHAPSATGEITKLNRAMHHAKVCQIVAYIDFL